MNLFLRLRCLFGHRMVNRWHRARWTQNGITVEYNAPYSACERCGEVGLYGMGDTK